MRVEEFTQQGFEECPPELLPSVRTPFNEEANFFVKEVNKGRDKSKHYLVIEENGSKSKIKMVNQHGNAGWIEHIMNLNID